MAASTCGHCSVKGARATVPLQRCRNDTAIQVKNHLLKKTDLLCNGNILSNYTKLRNFEMLFYWQ